MTDNRRLIDCRSGYTSSPHFDHYDISSLVPPRYKEYADTMQKELLPSLSISQPPAEIVSAALSAMQQRATEVIDALDKHQPVDEKEAVRLAKRLPQLEKLLAADPDAALKVLRQWEEQDRLDKIRINRSDTIVTGNPEYNLIQRTYSVEEKEGKIVVTQSEQKRQVPIYGYHNMGGGDVGQPVVSIRTHDRDDIIPVGKGADTKMVRAGDLAAHLKFDDRCGYVAKAAGIAMDIGFMAWGGIGIYAVARLGLKTVGWLAATRSVATFALGASGVLEDNAGALAAAPSLVSDLKSARHTVFMAMAIRDLAGLGKKGLVSMGLLAERAPPVVASADSATRALHSFINDSRMLSRIDQGAHYTTRVGNYLFAASQGKEFIDNLAHIGAKYHGR